MSRNTSNESRGSDGSWFLEAVGAVPGPPTPSEVVAELDAENTHVDDLEPVAVTAAQVVTFDGDPGTSTSSMAPPQAPSPTPEPRSTPVEATAQLEDLEPPPPPPSTDSDDDLAPPLRSRRSFRWPIVIGLVVLIAIVAAAIWWIPRYVDDAALETRQSYYSSSLAVREYLPETQTGLDAITNPASTADDVTRAIPIVAELESRSFTMGETMAEPLPSVPGPVPSGPLEALEPLQERGAILATASSDLARRLGNAYVYRTSIPQLMQTGSLPIAATTQEVNEISVRLASSLAEDASVVADLPDDPAFSEVLALAQENLDWYADWQDRYLTALTGEDTATASDLVAEIEVRRDELQALNGEALLAFRTEADDGIVDLASEFDAYLVEVSSP